MPTSSIVTDICRAFAQQMLEVTRFSEDHQKTYEAAIRDDIIAIAHVVHEHYPDFNMDEYYRLSGYEGTIPVHSAKVAEVPTGDERWVRFFSEGNVNWHDAPEYNRMFLEVQQNYLNHLLSARGHVFLNEVFDQLGLPRESIGQKIGWVYGHGVFVDFNIPQKCEGNIRLEFNPTGDIWEKI